mgnify:CR=1 FL=1
MTSDELALTGRTVVAVRPLTPPELESEGWDSDEHVIAVVLDNGAVLYPGCSHALRPGVALARYAGELWLLNPDGEPPIPGIHRNMIP